MKNSEEIKKALEINASKIRKKIVKFIRRRVESAGAEGIVLGLSGGLDSSTTAFLCVEAIGEKNVLTIFMPEKGVTDSRNAKDAKKIAENLGMKFQNIEISSVVEKFKSKIEFTEEEKVARANLKARTRMVILYYYANMLDYLVAGTSNKSELRCGYFTKYGDGAADILPMGTLYKTQVEEVAKEIGVPQNIIDKKPSADLWKGQKDEDELGLPYEKIDQIYAGLDLGLSEEEIAETANTKKATIQEFRLREKNSKHKLRRPPAPKL